MANWRNLSDIFCKIAFKLRSELHPEPQNPPMVTPRLVGKENNSKAPR